MPRAEGTARSRFGPSDVKFLAAVGDVASGWRAIRGWGLADGNRLRGGSLASLLLYCLARLASVFPRLSLLMIIRFAHLNLSLTAVRHGGSINRNALRRMRIWFDIDHDTNSYGPSKSGVSGLWRVDASEVLVTSAAAAHASTAARAGSILSLIDLQWAPAHVDAIQILNGSGSIRLAHLDEAETARTSGVAIDWQRYGVDSAMRSKQSADFRIRRAKGKVSNINFSHVISPN